MVPCFSCSPRSIECQQTNAHVGFPILAKHRYDFIGPRSLVWSGVNSGLPRFFYGDSRGIWNVLDREWFWSCRRLLLRDRNAFSSIIWNVKFIKSLIFIYHAFVIRELIKLNYIFCLVRFIFIKFLKMKKVQIYFGRVCIKYRFVKREWFFRACNMK